MSNFLADNRHPFYGQLTGVKTVSAYQCQIIASPAQMPNYGGRVFLKFSADQLLAIKLSRALCF